MIAGLVIIAIVITFFLIKTFYYPVSLSGSQEYKIVKTLEKEDAGDDYVTYYHISFRGMKEKEDGRAELYVHYSKNEFVLSKNEAALNKSSQGAGSMWILIQLDKSRNIDILDHYAVSKGETAISKEQYESFPFLLRSTAWGHSARKYVKTDQQKAEHYFKQ